MLNDINDKTCIKLHLQLRKVQGWYSGPMLVQLAFRKRYEIKDAVGRHNEYFYTAVCSVNCVFEGKGYGNSV